MLEPKFRKDLLKKIGAHGFVYIDGMNDLEFKISKNIKIETESISQTFLTMSSGKWTHIQHNHIKTRVKIYYGDNLVTLFNADKLSTKTINKVYEQFKLDIPKYLHS